MSHLLSWPYDEVSVRLDPEGAKASVTAPWLNATVDVTADTRDQVHELVEKLERQNLAAADLALVNWFFKDLDQYPFCYTLPTRKESPELDRHERAEPLLALESVASLLRSTGIENPPDVGRSEWAWDWNAAAAFAGAEAIHPESLFSVARRFHLVDLMDTCDSKGVFEEIKGLTGDDFARAASLMVRQNHYVTQQCRESLLPALETAKSARPLVERFIRDESGHDRILSAALQSFTEDPESIPVARHTECLMHLLRFAAGRNFLGFAMAIDFFERSSYEETDPLAQLLTKGGFEKAAAQINRHMKINDAGGHENVARGFLAHMAPCDPLYALEALRLAEVISLFVMSVPRAALELYKNSGFVLSPLR